MCTRNLLRLPDPAPFWESRNDQRTLMADIKHKQLGPLSAEDEASWLLEKTYAMEHLRLKARLDALEDLVCSMGVGMGFNLETIVSKLKAIRNESLQKALDRAEDKNPSLAADIDNRTEDEIG